VLLVAIGESTSLQSSQSTHLRKAVVIGVLTMGQTYFAGPVLALEGDVVRPYVKAVYSYDDNLRKFSSASQAELATGSRNTADTSLLTGVGIILDKQISRQTLYADLSVTKTKFDRNSFLDNDGKRFLGRWDWRIGNYWKGRLEASHQESMVPFGDFRGNSLNLLTQDSTVLDVIRSLHPRWQLRGTVRRNEAEYSDVSQRAANLTEYTQEAELDYLSPTKSMVGLVYRHTRGDRPQRQRLGLIDVDNSYDENSLKLNVDWNYSDQTRLQVLAGWVERKHDDFSERDFRGWNGRANFNWSITSKTSMNASMWREANAQSFVTSSYTLNKGVDVGGAWNATSKIALQASYRYETIDFVGDAFSANNDREDTRKVSTISLSYRPILALRLNSYVSRNVRNSSQSAFEFESTAMGLTAQYEF